jgi:hypothetical protein
MQRTINYDTARQTLEALAQKCTDDINNITGTSLEDQVLLSSLRMYRAGVWGSMEMLETVWEAQPKDNPYETE